MEQEATYVGLDVAKARVDVAVRPTDDRWQVARDEAGIRNLVSRLKTLDPDMVVLEASGGLEVPVVAALAADALPVVVVNPRQVGILPGPPGRWPRPTRWMRRSWPTSPKPSNLPCVRFETPKPRSSTPWRPAGTR